MRILSILLILLFNHMPSTNLDACVEFIPEHPVRSNIMLQVVLKSYGYYTGPIDGEFNDKTLEALINFQISNNLKTDENIGYDTCNFFLNKENIIQNTSLVSSETENDSESINTFSKEIYDAQIILKSLSLYNSTIDGVIGPITKSAIINFQKKAGLFTDGILGPNTLLALSIYDAQITLKSLSLYSSTIDGVIGPITKSAIINFQKKAGLFTDGILGPNTIASLKLGEAAFKDLEVPVWSDEFITITNLNPLFFDVIWGEAFDNEKVDKFKIIINGNDYKTVNADVNQLVLENLTRDTFYEVTIVAIDSSGNISIDNPSISVTTPYGPDTEAPKWDTDNPPFLSEIGTKFNINFPPVTDDVGVVSYEVYVNGALSSHIQISESRLFVTPFFGFQCADQNIYVMAFDAAGNKSQSPTIFFPQEFSCSSYYAVTFGGTSVDTGNYIDVDPFGNTYITGQFQGTVNFGDGNVTAEGTRDIFILKLDSIGTFQWVKTFNADPNLYATSIKSDSSGNTYITGYFKGVVSFHTKGVVPIVTGNVLTTAGEYDIFALKLDSLGNTMWAKRFGGPLSDYGLSLELDSTDNVYITGHFQGTVNFGRGNTESLGNRDIFVLKLDSSGVALQVNRFGGLGNDFGESITLDSDGNIYITGHFKDEIEFESGVVISPEGLSDIFVLKLENDGDYLWVKTYGSYDSQQGQYITVDSTGNTYITGFFQGTIDFEGGDLTSAGGYDIFVLKLDSLGNYQWSKIFGGISNDYAYYIDTDSLNNIFITGHFQGMVTFGDKIISSLGSTDIFVLKLDSSGKYIWAESFGGPLSDYGKSLAIDSTGNVYITGHFQGTVDFGINHYNSLLDRKDLVAERSTNGSFDVFILKLKSDGSLIQV